MPRQIKEPSPSRAQARITDRTLNALRDGSGGPFTKAQQKDLEGIRAGIRGEK